jgi:hypothetical protein
MIEHAGSREGTELSLKKTHPVKREDALQINFFYARSI